VILGKVELDDPTWDIRTVLTNNKYTHIRTSLSSDIAPWGDICAKCALFRKNQPFSDRLRHMHIRKVQLEPSLTCNLDCPCCSSKKQRKTRNKPFLMKLEILETLMKSLSKHSYLVERVEYCGQGEPLMHPKFSEFVNIVKLYYPNVSQLLITNGNFDYWKVTRGLYIDTIYVSCDGVFQKSYEKYRIGGNVDLAIKFMKDIPKTLDGKKQRILWKYILFEFNDSKEELIAAQRLAHSIGIDTLMFVFTHSRFKSVKYRPENILDLPIIYPNVTTNITPQFLTKDMTLLNIMKKKRFLKQQIMSPIFSVFSMLRKKMRALLSF